MAYSEYLADRMRNVFKERKVDFSEKKMMGGLAFMVDNKMCAGIIGDQLMARIGPEAYSDALEMDNVREMDFTGRALKGYVYIDGEGIDTDDQLAFWIDKCLAFNPLAKASKKKK